MSPSPSDRSLPDMAGTALYYAGLGWRIWPVQPRTRWPFPGCPHRGPSTATGDVDAVAELWRRWPFANIVAVLPPGRVVVDLDPRNGCTLTPTSLSRTLTASTGGGGWHCHFAYRGDLTKTSARHPGVDMLRPGQAVTLPPSLHRSGRRYSWLIDAPVVPLPGWLAVDFLPPSRAPRSRSNGDPSSRRQAVIDRLAQVQEGNRHNLLHWSARRYHEMGLSVDDALDDLIPVLPLGRDFTESEARSTIRSVWR